MNGNQPQMLPAPRSKTWLWVLIGVLVVVILLFAVYYFYYGYVPGQYQYGIESKASDEVSAIESDLNNTSVDNLDTDLADIDKELAQ